MNFTDPTGLQDQMCWDVGGDPWFGGNEGWFTTCIDAPDPWGGYFDDRPNGGGPPSQEDTRTVCERMADDAQRLADQAVAVNPMKDRPDSALGRFNREFGLLTFGSYFTPNVFGFVGTWASGRDNVLGDRDYQGDSGFDPKFTDTLHPGEDQVHHFGAYLSAGITGHKLAPDMHRGDDRENNNFGDVQLSDQSRWLGDYLRRNPEQLANIGQLIRDTICKGGEVPK